MRPTTPSTTVSSATSTWTSPLPLRCHPHAPACYPAWVLCVREGKPQFQALDKGWLVWFLKNIYLVVLGLSCHMQDLFIAANRF